jgi:hypothetical protein
MMHQKPWRYLCAICAAVAVTGCSSILGDDIEVVNNPIIDPRDRSDIRVRRAQDGSVLEMFGINSSIGDGSRGRGEAFAGSVNKHLWLASLDTLSFLPIASTDPFTGVIATDWGGATDAETERFRVTAYVTDTALSPDSLRVAVFREVREADGPWISAPVSADTPRQIEDSILLRARQLRIEEEETS